MFNVANASMNAFNTNATQWLRPAPQQKITGEKITGSQLVFSNIKRAATPFQFDPVSIFENADLTHLPEHRA